MVSGHVTMPGTTNRWCCNLANNHKTSFTYGIDGAAWAVACHSRRQAWWFVLHHPRHTVLDTNVSIHSFRKEELKLGEDCCPISNKTTTLREVQQRGVAGSAQVNQTCAI